MNPTGNNFTLVCYDITSNKLRCKIDKCMKDFGTRLQYSVFICRLDADGITRCREKLAKVLSTYHGEKGSDDSLIIFEQFNPNIADSLLGQRIEREISSGKSAFGIF